MEYGFGPISRLLCKNAGGVVLILVLMEYGLGRLVHLPEWAFNACLNPCFNGIWSRTTFFKSKKGTNCCLNPCFNGIWSRTAQIAAQKHDLQVVLILVLMEYGLGHSVGSNHRRTIWRVLILVLMEYVLGQPKP